MSSKGIEKSSHYGSLDSATCTNLNYRQKGQENPYDVATQTTTPPKPAVRQRIQKLEQQTARNSLLSTSFSSMKMSSTEVQVKNPTDPPMNQNNDSRVEISRQLNKCLAKVDNDRSSTKNGILALPLPTELQPPVERKYPKRVFFIVANEFCERFSYYGLRAILVLYIKSVLGFSDANSTVTFHLFVTLCYLTPVLGAILGDSVLGKFKTILYLSIVYFFGELILVLSSIFWDLGFLSAMITFLGLILIGIGTGGIKPCVCALGGDQFLPDEDTWRQTFFSVFYGAINLGSLISMFLTPMLRSDFHCAHRNDCYPLAFGLPCALMLLSILVFLMAKNRYVLVPLPKQNVIIAFCQCVWLALKRKLTGYKLTRTDVQASQPMAGALADSRSGSSLSASSSEETIDPAIRNTRLKSTKEHPTPSTEVLCKPMIDSRQPDRSHWLHLASDQFDSKSIEEFRSVLSILLLFLPLPVYWCLFDQQGSLWTLQATRMDGGVFNTGFALQPDQMSVANPLLLLAAIPIFEVFIYPSLRSCNLLTKPIQRMTVGGMLAALAFVLSALIEIRIQQFTPPTEPVGGKASILFVNGLSECSVVNSTISYIQLPGAEPSSNLTGRSFGSLSPLGSVSLDVWSGSKDQLGSYQFKFHLASEPQKDNTSVGCPFDPKFEHNIQFNSVADKSVKLLYLEQGNGKIAHRLFDESLQLPPAGKARIRLIHESFGSQSLSDKRRFHLVRLSTRGTSNSSEASLRFKTRSQEGQVSQSEYLDVDVSVLGDRFSLRSNDQLIGPLNNNSFLLKPGTRSLLVVHQKDANTVEIKRELLQDNSYRISMLYQLGPYLLISVSEVMFSATGLEFSYSMAPPNMKSVILGAWCLTIAIGNILVVGVESMHLFSSVVNDFFFYALLMALDMAVFAYIGSRYKPSTA